MIDIDKELEWTRENREDRHIGSISKHECVVDVDWVEELLTEVKRLREIEQEWLMMWATLEELNLVADVRKNMTLHGFVFPTDEDMEGDEE